MRRNYSLISVLLLAAAVLLIHSFGKAENIIDLVGTLVATFLGVFVALQLNVEKAEKDEKEGFESALKMLDLELEHNLSVLGKHRIGITTTTFNYGFLGTSLINLFLEMPSTIKYGGKVFRQALLSCRSRTGAYLYAYSRFEQHAYLSRGLPEAGIESLHDLINQTEYIIALLRSLICKYERDPRSLLDESSYLNYGSALELEKKYRTENLETAYEKLKTEVVL